ncbi:MAG: ComEA family DNA-binding protein [Anaerolineae bacterium]|jgi:competence protein ComEA|nr:ComEA family DNA-binding protein [Anaerolineae bacterium]MBT7071211.1 ComEA family DNA-binding protein [Anaerolineae bacterium]MBT7324123.1 ComEA family DNA-binding protein [Anaerolineae bacterium]
MKDFLNTIIGILVGMLLAGIIWLTARQPSGDAVALRPPPTPAPISVHITGAVVSPGIYEVPEGSRVADAVAAAGGFLPIADDENINLAALLDDGAQLNIEKAEFYNAGGGTSRVNINTASLDELDTLPGIGPSTAQAIIDYRRQYGNFQRTDEITNVSGIGPATYERIKDLITAG